MPPNMRAATITHRMQTKQDTGCKEPSTDRLMAKVRAYDLPWNLATAYVPTLDREVCQRENHSYAHSTGGTHMERQQRLFTVLITLRRRAGDNLVRIVMEAEDKLVSATTISITSLQTGSPGKSLHQEQRGPWSKDGPASHLSTPG